MHLAEWIAIAALVVGIVVLPTLFQMLWGRPRINIELAEDRTDVPHRLLVTLGVRREPANVTGVPYRFTQNYLVNSAKAHANSSGRSSRFVTDFSKWVHRLYLPNRNLRAMEFGRQGELELVRNYVPSAESRDWNLVHNGIEGDEAKNISNLAIRDQPMRGSPDFVFKHRKTGRVVVVEVKFSPREIPANGWPDLRAQLWAYSQIDNWRDAPEILLVGEVWILDSLGLKFRCALPWSIHDQGFNSENLELFNLYKNHGAKSHVAD